jgi:hypothetical protein
MQPGHEYTKGNVKFALSVSQDSEVKRLEALATNEKETQGKSTIGDEKVSKFGNPETGFGNADLLFRNTTYSCESP